MREGGRRRRIPLFLVFPPCRRRHRLSRTTGKTMHEATHAPARAAAAAAAAGPLNSNVPTASDNSERVRRLSGRTKALPCPPRAL